VSIRSSAIIIFLAGHLSGRGQLENDRPRGEIGILRKVELSNVLPADRCFLYIEYEGSSYIGCLLLDDSTFCGQVATLLKGCCNRPIAEIGGLDLSPNFVEVFMPRTPTAP
jgi:hypothetical protein